MKVPPWLNGHGRRNGLPIYMANDNPSRLRRQGGIRKQYVNFRALSPLFPKILAARPDMRYTVGIHRIREGAL
jgi:hypothetical protein